MADQATKLKAEMDALLRSLRQCDDQASAVKWMAGAYDAMDGALRLIASLERRVREEASEAKGLIFYVPKPKIEVVQTISQGIDPRANSIKNGYLYYAPPSQTVVYPEIVLHPGLKPLPKPWTVSDDRKLAAQNMTKRIMARLGK